jgi:hypothetical protein
MGAVFGLDTGSLVVGNLKWIESVDSTRTSGFDSPGIH